MPLFIISILISIPTLAAIWFAGNYAKMKAAKKRGDAEGLKKCKTMTIISGVIALVTVLGVVTLCITFTLSIAHM